MERKPDSIVAYLQTFLSRSRCMALAYGEALPAVSQGVGLFADISGFTPLAESLNQGLGDSRQGAEVLTRLVNDVFEALIHQVLRFGGDVLGFAGDAMLCWFADAAPATALTCALALQREMEAFAAVADPTGKSHTLTLKVGLAAGPARCLQAGAPEHGIFELLTGATLLRVAEAEHHAQKGEIIAAPEIVAAIGAAATWGESREGFRPLLALAAPAQAVPVEIVPLPETPVAALQPYFPPDLFTWLSGAQGQLQAELRPVVSAFVRFEGLDYEHDPDVAAKLNAYVTMLQRSAAYYGGNLMRLDYGDKGNMAHVIFGAPVAHEDDEIRAVGWILEAQAAVQDLPFIAGQTIGATRGQVYAGVLGGALRRGYTLMGDEVNASARLMQACQRGQALVSQRIIKAAQKQYLFHQFPGFQVKGKYEPIPVGTPVAALPPGQQLLAEGPLLGREHELATLLNALETMLKGNGSVVRLEGAAGTGKSRLAGEFMHQALERGVHTLMGSAQSVGQKTAYLAWRDIFRVLFGLQSAWPAQQQARQIEMQLRWLNPDWLLRAPLLGDVLGIPLADNPTTAALTPQLRQQALFALIEELLARMAEQIPLLIVLEDCQWLDEASTALIHALAANLSTARVMLVCLHRPPEAEVLVLPKLGLAANYLHLQLEELPPEAVRQLATAHLGGELPPDILKMIEERSQGNPFFVKELAETLREASHLRFEDGRWVLVGSVQNLNLPDSIQGVILARLDRLDEGAKLTLKVASVVGRRFAIQLIEHIHPEDVALQMLLSEIEKLEQRDITQTEIPQEIEQFKSNAMWEVTYATLLYAQRQALHRAVAQWYEAAFTNPADLQPYYPLLAHHYRFAGESARERHYAVLAGQQAAHDYANREALEFLGRALVLTPDEALEERYTLLLLREGVNDILGEREAQKYDLDALQTLAETLGDTARQAEVALRRANYAEGTGDFAAAVSLVQQAITEAQETGVADYEAAAYLRWGRMLWKQGDFAAARTQLERALALAQEHAIYKIEAEGLLNLGIVAAQQGQPDAARGYWEQTLTLCRLQGDQFTAHKPLNNLGLLAWMQNDLVQAQNFYEQSLAICRTVGYREGEASLLNNLGLIAIDRGNYGASKGYFEQALQLNRKLGNRWLEALALDNLGLVSRMLGSYEKAQAYFEQALRLNRELGNRVEEIRCLSNASLLYHQQQAQQTAREAAEQAVLGAQELGERSIEGDALTYWGHALAALGEREAARDAYQKALALRSELGEVVRSQVPRAGLIELALSEGNLPIARGHADAVLAFLETQTLDGAEEPFRIYWAVYRALQAEEDSRASMILAQAHARLQSQAAVLPDEDTRRIFLEAVASHRAISAAAAALAPASTAEETPPAKAISPNATAVPEVIEAAAASVPAAAAIAPASLPSQIEGSTASEPQSAEWCEPQAESLPLKIKTKVKQKRNRKGELVIKVTIIIKSR